MIYLDNAATTRPDEGAVRAAMHYLQEDFFNPSALYREGFAVHKELEEARRQILSFIAAPAGFDLIFTASGSEADNQALFCTANRGNIVTTAGEHAAIYNSAKELQKRGIEVRFAKLNGDGSVNADDLLSLVDSGTSLVSVIHVNNETGAVNQIAELAKQVKQKNRAALFHSDGVQAFGKIPFCLSSEIDLYTFSAHKIGGVRGAAGLVRKKSANVHPLIYGGGQEKGFRSGTENLFAIKQFEFAATKKFAALESDYQKIAALNRYFRENLRGDIFEILSSPQASPYILSVSAKGLRGEVLLHMLDDEGVVVGTGSACSSKNRYSRVILACGIREKNADGVLRISFSVQNTMDEAERAVSIFNRCAGALAEKMR